MPIDTARDNVAGCVNGSITLDGASDLIASLSFQRLGASLISFGTIDGGLSILSP